MYRESIFTSVAKCKKWFQWVLLFWTSPWLVLVWLILTSWKSQEQVFQTTEDYIDDARLERELTGDELMLLPNEDIGTESDLAVELDDNESEYFPLGYRFLSFLKWFNFCGR